MSSRKILLLACALVVGLGTFVMFRTSMTAPTAVQAPIETTEILAAARDLPIGTILRDTDMKWIPWAATAENSKFYVKGKMDLSTLIGGVLRQSLHGEEPILIGRVVQPHDQGFLAAVLTPGMRAVAISLSPTAGVAGFIFPGDRVDVILTHSFSRKDVANLTERHVSETVVTNARVLALDQKSDDQTTEPKIAQLATLEVSPRQAEQLALAGDLIGGVGGNKGSLSLALRSLATSELPADPSAAPNADAPPPVATSLPASAQPGNASVITGQGISLPPITAPLGATNADAINAMPQDTTTRPVWDSDVSPAYPSMNGEDGLMQKVQVMRGKEMTETTFERRH